MTISSNPSVTPPHGTETSSDHFLLPLRFVIDDRDPVFTDRFADLLRSAGVDPVKLPLRSPNLNAYAERFVRSIKQRCLPRFIPIGERHLRPAIGEYADTTTPSGIIRDWTNA